MLEDSRVYLCGAMSFDQQQEEWREALKPFLRSLGIRIFDPTDKPIDTGVEDKDLQQRLLDEEKYDEFAAMMKEIRCVDLRMIDVCDFIIANLDVSKYTAGTWEELALANREKKPILVHVEQRKKNAPPWLFGMIPHQFIFSSWLEIKDYLLDIDERDGVHVGRRWYLFDHSRTT
jgi:nucleoside 2-deoxyribosyltransferase